MPSKRRPESGVSPSGSRKSTRLKKTKREDDDVLEEAFDDARISPVKTSTPTNKVEEAFVDDGDAPISPVKASTPTNKVEEAFVDDGEAPISPVKASTPTNNVNEEVDDDGPESRFIGKAVPDEEAGRRWPHRYKNKQNTASKGLINNDEGLVSQARCHYTRAEVDGRVIINLYDDAYVQGEDGKPNYICKVIEMFEAVDGNSYFTAQWFYRAKDTVIKDHGNLIDNKRVFFSEIKDDNPLGCLIEKLNIVKVPLNVDLEAHRSTIPDCDYYYDMLYLLPCSTFIKVPQEIMGAGSETISTISSEVNMDGGISDLKLDTEDTFQVQVHQKAEMFLLDLYAGCGAMSTGLCLGANTAGLNLTTRWAVDLNAYACESLKLNHPETEVRNEKADDFLSLLKEWKKLCIMFSLIDGVVSDQYFDSSDVEDDESDEEDNDNNTNNGENDGEIFEVAHILTICYGDPKEKNEPGLHFKVRWKGYGPSEDSWEPLEGLRNCRERVKDFVVNGYKLKILPLRGDVDVICGGPPCQGISGFNRFRNKHSPLNDPKNEQLLVFMDVVNYLKPKFVLMENVVDLLKFSDGYLGRYALSRLIQMNYQTRMGMMAAGSYGLPQYRNRVFIWGALPTEILPQYPLPTHEVVIRGVYPLEFEENIVRYSEGHVVQLEKKLLLEDAISDLPAVTNDEQRDDMPYGQEPQSDFQQFIRLGKDELLNSTSQSKPSRLFDHRPLQLNPDDYERVCQIPKRKGANFRDLPGVRVRPDNKVEFDPDIERVLLRSGKPLVPDYAMSFVKGSSSKPFARLWWDETVPTVVTRAEPHNQQIIHPEQDRVLSIRENARLQGFPDYYKLCGPVKERYIQVGNAVAVPVARALGHALGLAFQGTPNGEPLFSLPQKFPLMAESLSLVSSEDEA